MLMIYLKKKIGIKQKIKKKLKIFFYFEDDLNYLMLSKIIFVIVFLLYIKLIVYCKLGLLVYLLMVLVLFVDYLFFFFDQFLVLLVDMIKSQMDIMEFLGFI